MPYVVNGTGTWYYGKNRVHRISGTCPNCNAYAELPSYDTTKYLTVLFIPLIPLSKWRVLEECPSCGKHRALKLKQWEESKAEDSRHVTEELRQNPDSPEAIQKVMAVAAMYQDEQLFLKIADTLAKPMTYDAGVQAQLGHAYAYFSRLSDAEEAFRASLAVKHDPEVAEALALQLLRQGRPDEAQNELQHCLKSDEAKHSGFVYLLGEGYLANGQPDRALELFDQATTMDPSIAADKQYQKLRKRAEKLRGTGKSIPSALLTPSKKAGYEEGGKGGKVAAWIGPLVALVLLAWYLGYAWSLGNEREVFVVNGLNAPLTATVGSTSVELQPQGRRAIKIPEGTVHVSATTGGKSIIDEDLELHTNFFARPFISPTFIINPDQTALLTWEKQYYAEDVADAPEGEGEYHVGQVLYEFRGLDFEFLPFPGQVRMGGSSKYVSRTRVDTIKDVTDEDLVYILPTAMEESELTTYLKRRAEFEPRSEFWIAFASSKMSDEEFLTFIREGLEDRPVRIAWHRFYQSKMEELQPEHDLEAEYQAYLASDPENADLIYLSGRAMKDIDASIALFRRAAEADPPSAYGAYALAYYHLCAGEFDKATPLTKQAIDARPDVISFKTLDRSLKLATGRIDELLAQLEAKKSEATFVLPLLNESIELYARQGTPEKAREQINAMVQEMTLSGNGEIAKQFQSFLLSSLAYCLGDREEYLSLNEDVEEPGFDLHFTRGDLHEAVDTISAEEATSNQIDKHFAVYLKAQQVGEGALAEQELSKAIDLLRDSSPEEKLYAEALSHEGTSDPDRLLALTVLPNNKRVILAALGVRHPADRDAYWGLARRLNYERKFPWLFLNDLLNGE